MGTRAGHWGSSWRRGFSLLLCVLAAGCAQGNRLTERHTACLRDPPAGVEVRLRLATRQVVEKDLEALETSNALRAERIQAAFREAGCEDALDTLAVRNEELPNVVCEIDGTGERVIVIGAHYDKVAAGDGAADNWSGAALLPNLFRSLSPLTLTHDLRFIAFAEEERGLIGSRAYVQSLSENELRRIDAMVNLDTLGLGPTHVEAGVSDPELFCWFVLSARSSRSEFRPVNADRVGTSDFTPFRKAGVPVLSVHSISQEKLSVLHSDRDTLRALDRTAYYQTYRLLALYLSFLDQVLNGQRDVSGDPPTQALAPDLPPMEPARPSR